MSDEEEKNEAMPPTPWERMPRQVKRIVYATLREGADKYAKDAAVADLVVRAVGGTSPNVAMARDVAETISAGFWAAIEELEFLDPELCPDCGGYHDDGSEEHKPRNPKDLS